MFVDIAMSGHAETLTTQTNAGSGHPPIVIERDVASDEYVPILSRLSFELPHRLAASGLVQVTP